MQKLGPHVIQSTAPALAWAAKAPVVKGLDNIHALQVARPNAIRVFRHYFENQPLTNARRVANEILSALHGYNHPNLYLEVYNEVGKEGLLPYIELLKQVVPLLHSAGYKVAGPSWATGDYEAYDWEQFRKANWGGMDAIALHAYWATEGHTSWNALRWDYFWRVGDPPILITECGRDRVRDGDPSINDGWVGNGGWKADSISPETYLNELARYDVILSHRESVLGATVFTAGATEHWENYNTDGLVIPTTEANIDPAPQEQTTMPEFRFGVKAEADRLRTIGIDPGDPLRDEYWFLPDTAIQPSTTGLFFVHKIDGNYHVQFYRRS